MAKKIDGKTAALAAAQGSVAVFDALQDEPEQGVRNESEQAPEPKHDRTQPDDARPAAAAQAPTPDKDIPTMNAQTFAPAIEAATDGMRTIFEKAGKAGGAAFDAPAMMERTQKLAQDAAELAKGNLEAMEASARIAAQNAGTLTQDAAAIGRKGFEGASEAMKSFAAAKSPVELLRLQSEFAKTYLETMIAEGTKLSETMVKLTNEALQPVQSQMAATAAKVKSITN